MDKPWCCAGQACCICMCGVCMRVCSTSHQHHIRIGYLLINFIAFFFGIIFLYYGEDMIKPWEKFGYSIGYTGCTGPTEKVCLNQNTIYRESFTLTIFYLIMAVLSLSKPASLINSIIKIGSCWILKVFLISMVLIITFFIPDTVFV
jgi:Serine incorporator (Serinc)